MAYIGIQPISKATQVRKTGTTISASSVINIPTGFTPKNIEVYINGLYVQPSDYDDSDGFNIDFSPTVLDSGTDYVIMEARQFEVSDLVPIGSVIMYSGSIAALPDTWALCDGTGGTPDLRGKFVIGSEGAYTQGQVGGSADAVVVAHTHNGTTASGGSHGHSASTSSAGNHSHTIETTDRFVGSTWTSTGYRGVDGGTGANGNAFRSGFINTTGAHTHSVTVNSGGSHTHTFTTDSEGQSGVGANLPPYYALAYIIKVA